MSFEQDAYEIDYLWDDSWFGAHEHEKHRDLAQALPRSANTLLDAGCGNGLFLRYLAKEPRPWERLCGADRSESALKNVTVEKFRASVDELPFENRSFDIVTSSDVLEHLPLHIYAKTLQEFARVAKQHILINVPFDEDLRSSLLECPSCTCQFNVNYHMRSFNEGVLRPLFSEHGFNCTKILHISPMKTLPRSVVSAVFRVKGLLARAPALPDYAVCPVCGWRGSNKNGASQPWKPHPVKELAKKLIPHEDSYRWIAALYERAEPRENR